jgi:hypothetical protein
LNKQACDEVKMKKNFIIKDCDQINNQFRYFNIIDFISIFQLNFLKKFLKYTNQYTWKLSNLMRNRNSIQFEKFS